MLPTYVHTCSITEREMMFLDNPSFIFITVHIKKIYERGKSSYIYLWEYEQEHSEKCPYVNSVSSGR